MKLVSISAVRLVIIVMVAYVIVLVQSDSTFIFLAPVSSTNVKTMDVNVNIPQVPLGQRFLSIRFLLKQPSLTSDRGFEPMNPFTGLSLESSWYPILNLHYRGLHWQSTMVVNDGWCVKNVRYYWKGSLIPNPCWQLMEYILIYTSLTVNYSYLRIIRLTMIFKYIRNLGER